MVNEFQPLSSDVPHAIPAADTTEYRTVVGLGDADAFSSFARTQDGVVRTTLSNLAELVD